MRSPYRSLNSAYSSGYRVKIFALGKQMPEEESSSPKRVLVADLLRSLDLGSSVAESDAALERYFVETKAFADLVNDRGDVIAGDKGTGKTALFRILMSRYPTLDALTAVEVVAGFNVAGNPVFQRLGEIDLLEEGQYIALWKTYIFALVANWVLDLYVDAFTDDMKTLEALLTRTGLNSADDAPETVFSQLVNRLKTVGIKSAELAVTLSQNGIPVLIPRVQFGDAPAESTAAQLSDTRRRSLYSRGFLSKKSSLSGSSLIDWMKHSRVFQRLRFPRCARCCGPTLICRHTHTSASNCSYGTTSSAKWPPAAL